MHRKSYYPQLIEALRETLKHLEASRLVPADDPAILELKAAIVRAIGDHERKASEGMAA